MKYSFENPQLFPMNLGAASMPIFGPETFHRVRPVVAAIPPSSPAFTVFNHPPLASSSGISPRFWYLSKDQFSSNLEGSLICYPY